jgi:hypothetical protein
MKPKQKSGVHERKIGHREKTEATPPKLSQFCGRHEQINFSIEIQLDFYNHGGHRTLFLIFYCNRNLKLGSLLF